MKLGTARIIRRDILKNRIFKYSVNGLMRIIIFTFLTAISIIAVKKPMKLEIAFIIIAGLKMWSLRSWSIFFHVATHLSD